MDFFDNVVNKSNAIIKERLNNPFGQRQSQDQQDAAASPKEITGGNSTPAAIQQQASISSADNQTSIDQTASGGGESTADGQDKNSQFAAIAADAEAVAQKAAKGAQKFGTFLFSMANKAGQTVTQTAKQVKQAVESTSILTDLTREQQEFMREHGGSMQAAELPWIAASAGDENKANSMKEQILSLSQDKRNFVRSPPQNSSYTFDAQSCYPIALSLLKEDQNLSKMRYELVPKLVSEDTFWCNYFYRVEMLIQESQGRRVGWASSRSSSGEGPDEITSTSQAPASQSVADDNASDMSAAGAFRRQESLTQQPSSYFSSSFGDTNVASDSTTVQKSTNATTAAVAGMEPTAIGSQQYQATTNNEQLSESTGSGEARRVISNAEDLQARLRKFNIGSFESGNDAQPKSDTSQEEAGVDDDDDEWDEELQHEFELVSGDLSDFDENDLKNDLLEIEKAKAKTADQKLDKA